jgi:hypothetical protein
MEMYTDERITKESFARGETIDKLIKETEDLYSEHFGEQYRCQGPTPLWSIPLIMCRAWRLEKGKGEASREYWVPMWYMESSKGLIRTPDCRGS